MNVRYALRVLLTSVALAVACARPAAADWQFAPLIGLTFKGSTTLVDLESAAGFTRWHFGGAVAFTGPGLIGVEGLFVYTPGFMDDRQAIDVTSGRTLALMGNLVLGPPRRWNEYGLRPFVSAGVGLLRTTVDDRLGVVYTFPINLVGYNVGGGATGSLTNNLGLRFELRYFAQLEPGPESGVSFGPVRLRYWTTSVGVTVRP